MDESSLFRKALALRDKKVIVFDLDGTLAESKTPLDKEMASLLRELLRIKKVAVLGGGDYKQFQKQFLGALQCDEKEYKNLSVLPVSGGSFYRYEAGKWQEVYRCLLSDEEKLNIQSAFERAFRDIAYSPPPKIYGDIVEDRESQMTFSAVGQKAPLHEKEAWNKKNDIREDLARTLKSYLSDFEVRLGGLTSVDVTKKGIDKAYGIQKIMEHLALSKEDVGFVGDALYEGGNDSIVLRTGITAVPVADHEETKKILRTLIQPDN